MEQKIYPKVLIIGQTFHKMSGGGITISNLFYGWPKDKVAVASNVHLSSNLDTSICEHYYQLGYNGKLHPFPINLFLPRIKCGYISQSGESSADVTTADSAVKGRYREIYRILSAVLKFLGVFNLIYRLKITDDFRKWVTEYNPDIIYSQLSSLELIRFVSELQAITGKPIALHIMDDWPNAMYKPEMFFSYWRRVTDREFRKLLDKSSILMSICESMSEEYKKRYNKDFIPFHNPIDVNSWLPFSKKEWQTSEVFKILYSGRVGKANGKSIIFMAQIINTMNLEGHKIELDIFTSDLNSSTSDPLRNLQGVHLRDTVPHSEMPTLLASYDLLFLPLDFDKVGINFAQFSMPTKTSEYMISGTPVMVYADKQTALAQYAIREKWAYVLTDNTKEEMVKSLNEIRSDIALRKQLSERAKQVTINRDDASIVRERFRNAFLLKSLSEKSDLQIERERELRLRYPRVLIIGQNFHKMSGGGITISNLFHGWPKENLAVASNVYLAPALDTSVCEQYYQLCYDGKLHPFPINLLLPRIKCGVIARKNGGEGTMSTAETSLKGKYKKIYKVLSTFLKFIGLYNVIYRLKLTDDFKKWVTDYNPDIIYSQLSTLELIRFVDRVHDLLKKPLALHIMDDWPNAMSENELFFSYWKKVTDREFRKLIDKSSILMSICDSMSEEYQLRYNRQFIPFHNPIELDHWLPYSKKDWQIKGKFTILYAGRIGRGIRESVSDLARAVENFSQTNDNIVFEILTFDFWEIENLIKTSSHIKCLKPLEYKELPIKFSSVDLLVLPEDYDSDSIEFLKYSLQTKVPEYMISGTPILVYADKRTALAKYALKEGWAYVVSENDVKILTNSLKQLYDNIDLRRSLAERAIKVATQNEDAKIVRENFRKNLILN